MRYEVILGVFNIECNAKHVAAEAGRYGIDVEIDKRKGGFNVCAGVFEDEKKAFDRLEAVQNAGYVFAYIRKECFG